MRTWRPTPSRTIMATQTFAKLLSILTLCLHASSNACARMLLACNIGRQHTAAYGSIRQHTSAYVSRLRLRTDAASLQHTMLLAWVLSLYLVQWQGEGEGWRGRGKEGWRERKKGRREREGEVSRVNSIFSRRNLQESERERERERERGV